VVDDPVDRRIGAVEILFDDVLNDGPEIAVLPLEPSLILREKPLEMMGQHTIEQKSEKDDGDGKYTENWISATMGGKENSLIAHLFHFKSIWTVI
jgi:hypothetical protein